MGNALHPGTPEAACKAAWTQMSSDPNNTLLVEA